LAQSIEPLEDLISDTILEQWHFSVSQTVQLERLLQRYGIAYAPMTSIPKDLKKQESAKDVLRWLKNTVDSNSGYL